MATYTVLEDVTWSGVWNDLDITLKFTAGALANPNPQQQYALDYFLVPNGQAQNPFGETGPWARSPAPPPVLAQGAVPVADGSGGLSFGTFSAPAVGDALIWDGSTWSPSGAYEAVFVVPSATGVAATDTSNIAAALAKGPGDIVLLGGSNPYVVNFQAVPGYPGFNAAILLSSGQRLRGQGPGTTIQLAAGQPATNSAFVRNATLNGGDHDMAISDITFDGNGAAQTDLAEGISFLRARGIKVARVKVQNVFGNAAAPPGETFHFNADTCTDVTYTDCQAIGSAGTQGTGFSDNSSTSVHYENCISTAMSAGMGFTTWHGSVITYSGCHAYLCGTNGFNAEFGADITYNGCVAGAAASDQAGGYFYANSQSLGNSGAGFTVNATARATLNGCISRKNGTGIAVVPTGGTESSAFINGGVFSDNGAIGIYFGDTACAVASVVSPSTVALGNPTANWNINGGVGQWSGGVGRLLPNPAVPASGTPITNPFPFTVVIYISGSIFFTSISGNSYGALNTVMLGPGETISVNYSSAPTWIWCRL